MKKIILVLLALVPCFAKAQLTKGMTFLGGSLSTSAQKTDINSPFAMNPSKTSSFSLSPSIGVMTSEKMAWGVALNYGSSSYSQDTFLPINGTVVNSKTDNSGFGISPFGRYYMPLSSAVYFAIQGTASAVRGTTKTTQGSSSSENSYYTLGLNFKPVLVFFPTPKWAVEGSIGSLGYSYNRYLPDVQSTTSFGLAWGSLSFGVSYFFVKK
ncbi:MAG TPA: hypothetical protein VL728_09265 [Cyclobacteriaceae bacterium]|nr:hypothetical protein [Cyclobacteriaceae bacterium]